MVVHPSQLQGDSLSVWKLPTLQPKAGFTRGSYYSLPQPSRLVWTAGGDEVTLPLPQPHSKGITFTENTHFQISTYAATSTLPGAWTSEHSSPKSLCPVTVPLCSSAYTCFFQRRFLYRQHFCPHHPALLSASLSLFPKGPPPCSVPTTHSFQYFWLFWGSAVDLLLGLVVQR